MVHIVWSLSTFQGSRRRHKSLPWLTSGTAWSTRKRSPSSPFTTTIFPPKNFLSSSFQSDRSRPNDKSSRFSDAVSIYGTAFISWSFNVVHLEVRQSYRLAVVLYVAGECLQIGWIEKLRRPFLDRIRMTPNRPPTNQSLSGNFCHGKNSSK